MVYKTGQMSAFMGASLCQACAARQAMAVIHESRLAICKKCHAREAQGRPHEYGVLEVTG